MRVFKSKAFSRFAARNGISNGDLCDAVARASRGLVDADLGGGVIKQRIARQGEGRSGGFRSIVLFRAETRAVFIHGFAKKDVSNIDRKELAALRKLAKIMLSYSAAEIAKAVDSSSLTEVQCDGKTVS